MVEITQAQAQVVLDWDMAKRQGFNQAIAALEQPTPELVEAVAKATYLAYAQHPNADWTAVDQALKDGIWYPQAKAALAAAANFLKGEGY